MVVPPPTTGPFRRLPFFIKEVVDTFAQKNASRMAGAIAYFGIFSFAPLLIVAVLIAGSVLRSSDANEIIIERLGEFVSPIVADAVGELLEAVTRPNATTIAGVVSGIALFFGASSVFIHVQMSLDDIFEAARRHRNGFIGMLLAARRGVRRRHRHRAAGDFLGAGEPGGADDRRSRFSTDGSPTSGRRGLSPRSAPPLH